MRTIRTLVVSAIAVLFLGSCAFWGTATLYITNGLVGIEGDHQPLRVSLVLGPGRSIIDHEPLEPGELKVVYLVAPGPTTVEAVIDYGARRTRTLVAEAGHTYMDIVFRD